MIFGDLLGIALVLGFFAWFIHKLTQTVEPSANKSDKAMLRQYNNLTLRAAEAARKGHVGESNVLQESAERLLQTWITEKNRIGKGN